MSQQTINIHPSVMEREMSAMIEFLRNRNLGNAQLAFSMSDKIQELEKQVEELKPIIVVEERD